VNIIRIIRKADRMEEIINSMRNPVVSIALSDAGIPDITIIAKNKDGVCKYIHTGSGLLDVSDLSKRFAKYINQGDSKPLGGKDE
jgi:hypothetical protein